MRPLIAYALVFLQLSFQWNWKLEICIETIMFTQTHTHSRFANASDKNVYAIIFMRLIRATVPRAFQFFASYLICVW